MSLVEQKDHMQENYDLLLFNYATGKLDPAQSMIVLSHTMLNDKALAQVESYETIGGVLIEDTAPINMGANALEAVFAKIDAAQPQEHKSKPHCSILPDPIAQIVNASVEDLKWRHMLPGIDTFDIKFSKRGSHTQLLRMAPGKQIAPHTHGGQEITLVLDGDFEDETGVYGRGDLVITDGEMTHTPRAGAQKGCICITTRTAPLHFKGLFSVLNPFLKH